jgi:NADH-quinone oxidoreductase subunit M
MLLAGVVMKLGAYGAMRVAMALFPAGMVLWQDSLAFLAMTGIVFGASVALVQTDFKFVIGYSSVSHMGFVLLGLMTLNQSGLAGAVLQMFSHGIIASLLFAVVGRMVYERTHTRELALLSEMNLGKAIPFAAFTFVAAGAASMGIPGFSGFVAELQVLIGAWQAFPWFAVFAGLGIIIGVAYTLRAIQLSFYGENPVPPYDRLDSAREGEIQTTSSDGGLATRATIFEAITWPERMGAILLMSATLAIGLYPRLLMDLILSSPWLEMLAKGGRP